VRIKGGQFVPPFTTPQDRSGILRIGFGNSR
jgi:hypothetical protein